MVEDLNETHLKRLIDTNEKARLFLIQILSHQKSAKGGNKAEYVKEGELSGQRLCREFLQLIENRASIFTGV